MCAGGHFAALTGAGLSAPAAVFPPIRHRKSQVVPATPPPAAATPWASTPLVSIPMVWVPFLWNGYQWNGMYFNALHTNPFHSIPMDSNRLLSAEGNGSGKTTNESGGCSLQLRQLTQTTREVRTMLSCVAGGAQLEPPVRAPHTVHVKTPTASASRTTVATTSSGPRWPPASSPGSGPAPGRWWPGPGSNPRDVVDSHPRCVVSVPAGG